MPVPLSQRPHTATDPTSTIGFQSGLYSTDHDGVPYYVFGPVWPVSPPGVLVQPFSQFSEKGIVVEADDGGVEVDGEGVPTIRLTVAKRPGDVNFCETKKAKKRKKKAAIALASAEKPWYEIWEDSELAGSIKVYNTCSSRRQRLSTALDDFVVGRFWTPHLQSIFDLLRRFLGLDNNPNRLLVGSFEDGDDFELQDSESDLDALDGAQFMREAMMDRFVHSPEHATKVFLSSFFSHSGLIWFHARLTDAPLLIRFFLSFLLKHDVFPDHIASLASGIVVTEQAHGQLQACWAVSQAMSLNELLGALSIDKFGTFNNFSGTLNTRGAARMEFEGQSLETAMPGHWEVTYAELSCRVVTQVTKSDAALFGVVKLTLWSGQTSLDLSAPRVLCGDSAGEREVEINVLMHSDVLGVFEQSIGLIVQAAWVKVQEIQREELSGGHSSWWYCERLHGAFPSYWVNDEFEQDY